MERISETLQIKNKRRGKSGDDEGKGTKGDKDKDAKGGKGKGGKKKTPTVTMSLEEREKSLEKWENMLQECFSTRSYLDDVFSSSPLYK